ncbi:LuxR family transcriptional regulator, maltose regulon positive regulatory protein [Amycolatopsis sacchari]|uniref:LuxR family transcriptional regulator, maltose regulon positive regulatory protein n=1 Tax=Amycolatopsis sacchari TaxID=115433 RepID=A0A1I3PYW8_9PSEU|nr:helix-turn-helix transcriptional regulator [Amycolatopsis sacchari]SFJ26411.1 LuxR family transcriptional regulator, maltose regulon positive regulatory protein [Amycolatopsis sacchari]
MVQLTGLPRAVPGKREATPYEPPADVPGELRRITAEGDWDALESLIDHFWLTMDSELGAQLTTVLTDVPEEELHARPRLMIGGIAAYHAAVYPDAEEHRSFLRRYTDLGRRLAATMDPEHEEVPATVAIVGTAAMIAVRAEGRFAEAEEFGQRLTDRLLRLGPAPAAGPSPRPGWLPMQRGLTRSLMGDFAQATELYRQAVEQAGTEPVSAYAAINATANLAMVFGHLGHRETARRWTERMRSYPPPSGWVSFLLTVGSTLADGWEALDRYDEKALSECLAVTGDGTKPIEVWPFVTALVAAHGLHFGEPAATLAHLGEIRLSHAPALADQGTARQVLTRARADLLLAAGQANRALRVITDAGAGAPWLALPAARLRLLAGEYEVARALAAQATVDPAVSRRDLGQLLLVKALAALRSGDEVEAGRAAAAAMRLRAPDEVLSLATLSEEDRAAIARLVEVPLTERAQARLAAAAPVFPERVELVELTNREHAVLLALAAGGTVSQIARGLVVSVNTVRTQLQSAYRKLGASNRQEALTRAQELGVLGR